MKKIRQQGLSDCGVACLAMVLGIPYEEAKDTFDAAGLSVRRGSKAAWSSNFKDLMLALSLKGANGQRKKFVDWGLLHGTAIIKTNVDPKGNWHWVVAYRDTEHGVVLLDPAIDLPCFEKPPLDVFYMPLSKYSPSGCYIELSVSHGTSKN